MHRQATTDSEVKQNLRERVEQYRADHGTDWARQFEPGSFACHELLDRTAFVARMVEELVLSHPSCALHEEWFATAEQAVSALTDLYQRVGEAHLSDPAQAGGGTQANPQGNPPEDH